MTSATALLGGCLDSLETDGTGSGAEDTDTDDTDTSDVDDSVDDEENEANDDDTDATDGEDQDADDSEQDVDDDSAQDGDESRDQDDESEHQGEDENEQADEGDESEQTDGDDEPAGDGTVEFKVIDMTPSMESGTEFTYIILAHTDGSESIPGAASLVDETGATVDSASYEAVSGGGNFELTYQAPTVDEDTEVSLMIETDHGSVNLGNVHVFPSETAENDDPSDPAGNSTENGDSGSPTENSTESDD
ncbi:hypothetical protein [Natronorubrum texcoconense]|uniref:hypothetical protein n=1 Tax=Natronorubrum texcoconense TaxID=1095776 RepID=UPI0011141726|nr:hypothetical protein [Natronorubrum texcoconense]